MYKKEERYQIVVSAFWKYRLLDFGKIVALSIFITIFLRLFVIEAYTVKGISMYPTLDNRDRILVFKMYHIFGRIDLNDIIVFHPPGKPNVQYVKRVIGRPGDEVYIERGQVYVNGFPIPQDYISWDNWDSSINMTVRVPEGFFFVLGDNRIHSQDSRSFGFVPKENIIGVAIFIFYPFSHFKSLF